MKAIIRWQGIGFFGFFIVLISVFSFFFIDDLIENVFENQGSKFNGARVDLGDVNLSFFPAGLELSRIQITNPDKPTRNSVEVDRITFSIDSMKLLQRKIIIDEMVMDGIRPDTPRNKSGALPEYSTPKREVAQEETSKGFKMPNLKIPDPKEVLANENLQTIKLAEEYQEKIKEDTVKWKQQLAELPNKEKMDQYIKRLDSVKSSSGFAGILGGMSELSSIKDEIQADLDRLKAAQNDFSTVSASYQKRLAKIQKAPDQDIKRLIDKYSPSAKGLGNLSPLLFGDKTGSIVKQALSWYKKVQPFLEREKEKKVGSEIIKPPRGKGVSVRFKEEEPLPDFLIRNIVASVEISAGSFEGRIKNVTPDQDVLGIPLSFAFSGESLQGLNAIRFDGELDHTNPNQSHDIINVNISGFSLAESKLSDDERLPVSISKGILDLSAQAVLEEQNVNADVLATLKTVSFTTANAQQSDVTSGAIANALSGINNLTAKTTVSGTIDDYTIKLSSDLDKILKDAVANTIKDQTAKFEQKLKNEIMDEVKGPIAGASGSFSDFGSISDELNARLQQIGNLL